MVKVDDVRLYQLGIPKDLIHRVGFETYANVVVVATQENELRCPYCRIW